MSTVPEIRQPGGVPKSDLANVLKGELTSAVRDYCNGEPRSQQKSIGASEIGTPCDRQLAMKAAFEAKGGKRDDPWAAFIGTAVHEKLEKVFIRANIKHVERGNAVPLPWEVETRVEFATGLKGTGDLFSYRHKTVIDHKVPADYVYDKSARGDISPTYIVQVDCYGLGFEQAGYDVENVAIAFWPRGKGATLSKLLIWTKPYEREKAQAAVTRWHDIVNAVVQLELDKYPERAALFATADAPCKWCPFFDYTGRREGVNCQGHKKGVATTG